MTSLFMGNPSTPAVDIPKMPIKSEVTSQEDAAAVEATKAKKRQGYGSTISAGNLSGLIDPNVIKKATLGT